MKVLIWACGFEKRFAGPYMYKEAARQGLDVEVTGSRAKPDEMLAALKVHKPDWVFCFALRPGFGKYYEAIRRTGAKLLFWYPDMTEQRRDRMWRVSLANQADVLTFSILETAQRYSKLAPTVLWMPQYFDHRSCMRDGALPKRLDKTKEIFDLCFFGSCDARRTSWLTKLSRRYKCNFVTNKIGKPGEIREWDMAEGYAQSKIAFNIQRQLFDNLGPFVTSNRTYNAMGSGAFFINHKVEKLYLLFQEGCDCAIHDNTYNGLCDEIDYYLTNPFEREAVARNGQRNVLRYHTLEQRVAEYWRVMETIHYYGNLPSSTIKSRHSGYGMWIRPHDTFQ